MFKRIFILNIKIMILALLSLNTVCDFEIVDHKNIEELKILIAQEKVEYEKLLNSKENLDKKLTEKKKVEEISIETELDKIVEDIKKLLGIKSDATTIKTLGEDIKQIYLLTKRMPNNSKVINDYIANIDSYEYLSKILSMDFIDSKNPKTPAQLQTILQNSIFIVACLQFIAKAK